MTRSAPWGAPRRRAAEENEVAEGDAEDILADEEGLDEHHSGEQLWEVLQESSLRERRACAGDVSQGAAKSSSEGARGAP